MATVSTASARRFLIPERVSGTEKDAGLVALAAILKGFGVAVSLERLLQDAEKIGDANALETLRAVADRAGLDTEMRILPADQLLLARTNTLPLLVLTGADDGAHGVVVWRRVWDWVQVMDTRLGRRWLGVGELRDTLTTQSARIAAAQWRAYAGEPLFLDALRTRLDVLLVKNEDIERWIAAALADAGWKAAARLDAAARMTAALVRAQALKRGAEATRVIERFLREADLEIPAQYWSVQESASGALIQRGVKVLRVLGVRPDAVTNSDTASPPSATLTQTEAQAQTHSLQQVLELMRADGLVTPAILSVALVLATLGIMVQALLFQGVLDLTAILQEQNERLLFLGAVLLFMLLLFAVEIPINALLLQMGRKLEIRFRLRFLDKIPHLGERFFQGHFKSDLVQRAHSLRQLHLLPELAVTLFRLGFQLLLTTLAIIWLDPPSAFVAVIATVAFLAVAYFTQPLLQERDYRLRTQMGALSRFYLDGMLGLVPLKMHGAQRAFRREYEGLVHDWADANWSLARLSNWLQALSVLVYAIFAVWLVLDFIARNGTTAGTLLFFFWILSLPALATAFIQAVQQYPTLRSLTLRVLEPLNAPDENKFQVSGSKLQATLSNIQQGAVALDFQNVSVQLGGNTVLRDINLHLRAGEHVAIVGPSGAGKTTLVGLVLGWHEPSAGECRADGVVIADAALQKLRRGTVWVDPAIQLWNRTLWENVLYGNAPHDLASPSQAIENADLLPVIEQFDAGLETVLGESGGLVSGGEGQRVRLARGMAREGTRLVILDEPFRGLDRETRRKLLLRAREFWKDVTLLCVTHDVNETLGFERVLVVEDGHIVQDAPPAQLANNPTSRYRALLDGEEAVRSGLWSNSDWRKLWIQDGALREKKNAPR